MDPGRPGQADARVSIRDRALTLGFDAVGFCDASAGPEASRRLGAFIAAGQHGEMAWLAKRAEQRASPTALWPDARGIVAVGLNYAPAQDPLATLAQADRGSISVYARGRDYHDIMKGRLKHLAQFMAARFEAGVKVFVDTAPVMEKPIAERAGLGWQGKHTNLVSRAHGSWLFLGEIYTTLAFTPEARPAGECGTCERCLHSCPTDAFPAPYRLDATRCLAYLTIEHAGPIPVEFRSALGNRIYGCDDCLAVCPWNKFAGAAREAGLRARDELVSPRLAELAALDDLSFRVLFAGSPIKRIGRDRFVRNVLYAIGNSHDDQFLGIAGLLRADPNPVVADAASWAVGQLGANG